MRVLSTVRRNISRNALLALIILALCIVLLLLPGFKGPFAQEVVRTRARVLEVDNADIATFGIVSAGTQTLRVQVLEGPYKGEVLEATNTLLGKMETDKMFRSGDTAFVVLDFGANGVSRAVAYDHFRLDIELILVLLFAALLIGFAGWGGVRALLSFAFALLLIWKVLLPGILLGGDPIWIALGAVMVLTAATLYLVAGVNKTAWVAFLGAFLGVLLTCGLALILLPPFRLHGAIQPFTETLLYSGFEHLNRSACSKKG